MTDAARNEREARYLRGLRYISTIGHQSGGVVAPRPGQHLQFILVAEAVTREATRTETVDTTGQSAEAGVPGLFGSVCFHPAHLLRLRQYQYRVLISYTLVVVPLLRPVSTPLEFRLVSFTSPNLV